MPCCLLCLGAQLQTLAYQSGMFSRAQALRRDGCAPAAMGVPDDLPTRMAYQQLHVLAGMAGKVRTIRQQHRATTLVLATALPSPYRSCRAHCMTAAATTQGRRCSVQDMPTCWVARHSCSVCLYAALAACTWYQGGSVIHWQCAHPIDVFAGPSTLVFELDCATTASRCWYWRHQDLYISSLGSIMWWSLCHAVVHGYVISPFQTCFVPSCYSSTPPGPGRDPAQQAHL